MPVLERNVLGASRGYTLRHVGPKSAVWPNPPSNVSSFQVLNQPDMVARPLPIDDEPASEDYQQGQWTGRLNDAGDGTATFPNATASDGIPWRDRFDSAGHNQWLEVYNDKDLEMVFCLVSPNKQMPSITVAGGDGFWTLKKCYERDWIVVRAPRDVIERGTQQKIPVVVDNFNPPTISPEWTIPLAQQANAQLLPVGGLQFTINASSVSTVTATSSTHSLQSPTDAWEAEADIASTSMTNGVQFALEVGETDVGVTYALSLNQDADGLYGAMAMFGSQAGFVVVANQVRLAPGTNFTLSLESDGEWIWAWINGQFIGGQRRWDPPTATGASRKSSSLQMVMQAKTTASQPTVVTFQSALLEAQQSFLQKGSDKGDYVLPGNISTYPPGGLHGRYSNNADLQNASNSLYLIHHPSRSQAYGTGSSPEYQNQQDATIGGQANPLPGAATSYWSAIWFGAIYLKLSAVTNPGGNGAGGDYQFYMLPPPNVNVAWRMWIGKTQYGDELADRWSWQTYTANSPVTVRLPTEALAGALPYDEGTVLRDGWYPIKIEYAVLDQAAPAPILSFANTPSAYQDPGSAYNGRGIPQITLGGSQQIVVPATSLSSLGCVDQRYQGISHFDLVQQTLNAFGYQASCEPKRLESGQFPGVLAPRVHEGNDTDVILRPETSPAVEPFLNYTLAEDASDYVSSLQGNGAGFQTGNTGTLQARVYDDATMKASLFDAQGWQDFSDASFLSLLHALLTSQLGLRLDPWQAVSGDPRAARGLAQMWPLPSSVVAMKWRPGDGARIRARDISVWDSTPRQMLSMQRTFVPAGVTATAVGWANRPRTRDHTLKQQLFSVSRLQRNHGQHVVTLTGTSVSGSLNPTSLGASSTVTLSVGDTIIAVYVSIGHATKTFNVYVNGTDKTSALGGGWMVAPMLLNLLPVAQVDPATNSIWVQVFNDDAVNAGIFTYQLFVDVLR